MDILLVDAALALIALGLVSLLRPLPRLHIRTRRTGASVALAGLALLSLGFALPAGPLRLPGPPMLLDEVVPSYAFGEHHETAILDVALRTSFVVLREEPGREIVVGSIVCCGRRAPPRSALDFTSAEGSLARAVMNFHLVPETRESTRLITQTRIATNDPPSTRRFAAYWRVIYPGSAFIRVMWLDAIKRRAEAAERPAS